MRGRVPGHRRGVKVGVCSAIVGWHVELRTPDTDAQPSHASFCFDIGLTELGQRNGKPRLNHGLPQVETIDCAGRDNSPIAVDVALPAQDGLAVYSTGEQYSRVLAAVPRITLASACLLGFRRINAVQPYALAAQAQGVAVDRHRSTRNDL